MNTEFIKISGSLDIIKTTCLANRIFGQHFTPMMPRQQFPCRRMMGKESQPQREAAQRMPNQPHMQKPA